MQTLFHNRLAIEQRDYIIKIFIHYLLCRHCRIDFDVAVSLFQHVWTIVRCEHIPARIKIKHEIFTQTHGITRSRNANRDLNDEVRVTSMT